MDRPEWRSGSRGWRRSRVPPPSRLRVPPACRCAPRTPPADSPAASAAWTGASNQESCARGDRVRSAAAAAPRQQPLTEPGPLERSEEHTSELQSQSNLVCRLLLEKKTFPRYELD